MLLCSSSASVDQNRQPAGHNNGILACNWSPLSPPLPQHNKYLFCVFLFWSSVPANQLDYTPPPWHTPQNPGRETRGVSVTNLYFLHSNYWGNNQWKTGWRSYRHFRSRNGVIFLNGNSWPPLKSFIICFRICTKSLEIWRKREFCPTSLK